METGIDADAEVNAGQIHKGMDVLGTDGEKLGTVVAVWPDAVDPAGDAAKPGYFKMEHGGLLGIGTTAMYVPFSVVCDIAGVRCITLACEKDECNTRFVEKPDFLDETAV